MTFLSSLPRHLSDQDLGSQDWFKHYDDLSKYDDVFDQYIESEPFIAETVEHDDLDADLIKGQGTSEKDYSEYYRSRLFLESAFMGRISVDFGGYYATISDMPLLVVPQGSFSNTPSFDGFSITAGHTEPLYQSTRGLQNSHRSVITPPVLDLTSAGGQEDANIFGSRSLAMAQPTTYRGCADEHTWVTKLEQWADESVVLTRPSTPSSPARSPLWDPFQEPAMPHTPSKHYLQRSNIMTDNYTVFSTDLFSHQTKQVTPFASQERENREPLQYASMPSFEDPFAVDTLLRSPQTHSSWNYNQSQNDFDFDIQDSYVQPWWPPPSSSLQFQCAQPPSTIPPRSFSTPYQNKEPFTPTRGRMPTQTHAYAIAITPQVTHRRVHPATEPRIVRPCDTPSPPTSPQISLQRTRPKSATCRTPSPSKSMRQVSRGHRRTKSGPSSSRAASGRQMSGGFVNYTPQDSRRILTGVAPSGSSKTKARREKEAAEKRRRLSQAAARAVLEAGGDMRALEREGFFV